MERKEDFEKWWAAQDPFIRVVYDLEVDKYEASYERQAFTTKNVHWSVWEEDEQVALGELERLVRTRLYNRESVYKETEIKNIWQLKEDAYQNGDEKALAHWNVVEARGVEDPCLTCKGLGTKLYGSSATYKTGPGASVITVSVCNVCWGSGDALRPWPASKDIEPSLGDSI